MKSILLKNKRWGSHWASNSGDTNQTNLYFLHQLILLTQKCCQKPWTKSHRWKQSSVTPLTLLFKQTRFSSLQMKMLFQCQNDRLHSKSRKNKKVEVKYETKLNFFCFWVHPWTPTISYKSQNFHRISKGLQLNSEEMPKGHGHMNHPELCWVFLAFPFLNICWTVWWYCVDVLCIRPPLAVTAVWVGVLQLWLHSFSLCHGS